MHAPRLAGALLEGAALLDVSWDEELSVEDGAITEELDPPMEVPAEEEGSSELDRGALEGGADVAAPDDEDEEEDREVIGQHDGSQDSHSARARTAIFSLSVAPRGRCTPCLAPARITVVPTGRLELPQPCGH